MGRRVRHPSPLRLLPAAEQATQQRDNDVESFGHPVGTVASAWAQSLLPPDDGECDAEVFTIRNVDSDQEVV